MQYVIYTIYVLVLTGINAAVFPGLSLFGAVPSLLLVSLVIISATSDDISLILFMALISGFFWELYTGLFPGSLIFGYMVGGTLMYMLSHRVFFLQDRLKYFPLFLVIFQAAVTFWVIVFNWYVFRMHWSVISVHPGNALASNLFSLFYNLIFIYPLYAILAQLERLAEFFMRKRRVIE